MPEEASVADKKEYAAVPLAFVRQYLSANGRDATDQFLQQVRIYPFISDLFGEYLRRNGQISEAANFLTMVTREVIGDMTLTDLCAMTQEPLRLLSGSDGRVEPSEVATIFRELYLSPLAREIERHTERLRPEELETILAPATVASQPSASVAIAPAHGESTQMGAVKEVSPPPAPSAETVTASVVSAPADDYSQFLSELKDAGVIIPPSSKETKQRAKTKRIPASETITDKAKMDSARATRTKSVESRSSMRGVETMLSPHAHEKILTKIFRGDEDDFRRSMDLINNAKDWKQASIFLDALFMRRKVDPDSKTATRLTDAVYARFHLVR